MKTVLGWLITTIVGAAAALAWSEGKHHKEKSEASYASRHPGWPGEDAEADAIRANKKSAPKPKEVAEYRIGTDHGGVFPAVVLTLQTEAGEESSYRLAPKYAHALSDELLRVVARSQSSVNGQADDASHLSDG